MTVRLPRQACDTHSHVYAPAEPFPLLDGHTYEAGGGLETYLGTCRTLGVSRHVMVQPKAYPDEASTLDAVARIGIDRARAILFLPPQPDTAVLDAWHSAGVRGFRFLYRAGTAVALDEIRRGAELAAEREWHLILQAEGDALSPIYDWLLGLPCPVVIDHIGRLGRCTDVASASYRALDGFVRGGGWVKLASPYNLTPEGESDFSMLTNVVVSLIEAAPERVIWGMNFPHPNLPANGKPDELATLDSLLGLVPDEYTSQRLFTDNPARLYGF